MSEQRSEVRCQTCPRWLTWLDRFCRERQCECCRRPDLRHDKAW